MFYFKLQFWYLSINICRSGIYVYGVKSVHAHARVPTHAHTRTNTHARTYTHTRVHTKKRSVCVL